jgi:hypothetical protein
MNKQPTPRIDSDLMLAELLSHQGPPLDIVSLIIGPDRDASRIRAAMVTDLLATGRVALCVEHDGFEGRLVVEPARRRTAVEIDPVLDRATTAARRATPELRWRG